jgi:deazaflavin-dependent oxidoreductase (nitroreductase family)
MSGILYSAPEAIDMTFQGLTTIIGIPLGVIAVLGIAFVAGMRWKVPFVLDGVRWMNKAVLNPRQLRTAGTPGAYADVISHVGRTSGKPYQTPIVAVPIEDGFVVALPYGTRADWVKNVLAADAASIIHAGTTHPVDRPEVVATSDVAGAFERGEQRSQNLFAVEHCLRVHTVDQPAEIG